MAVAKPGQIVLFRFPQTDLSSGKIRPALLIAEAPSKYSDWLVCMISSQGHQNLSGISDLISASDADFAKTGLKGDSIVRLTRLAIVSESIFLGTIGAISEDRLRSIKFKLADWIKK